MQHVVLLPTLLLALRPVPRPGNGPSPAALARAKANFNSRLDAQANATLAPLLVDKLYEDLSEADYDVASAMTEEREKASALDRRGRRRSPSQGQTALETMQQQSERAIKAQLQRSAVINSPPRIGRKGEAEKKGKPALELNPFKKSAPERAAEWFIRKYEELVSESDEPKA